MGEMLSNVSKHIQDTAQLAGAHKAGSVPYACSVC